MALNKKNCAEKLIFCIDLSDEVDSLEFARGGKTPTRLDLIKAALRVFVYAKQKMNPNHEFAICALTETAVWFLDFTTDIELFIKKLMTLQSQGDFQVFKMGSLFDLLVNKFPEIIRYQPTGNLVEHVYRVIFCYARSNTIPALNLEQVQPILDCPFFFLDALYLHAKPSKTNKPQEVYDFITEIEGKDHISYFFENSTSAKKFYLHTTHLLAHPLQRPDQSIFKPNSLSPITEPQTD